jgi:hypothetical protein
MSQSSEEVICGFLGKSVNDLRISMINVNTDVHYGVEEGSMSSTKKFLQQVAEFHPNLMKSYRDEVKALPNAKKAIADKIFMPLWFDISASKKKSHPKDFDGHFSSGKECSALGLYATHQVFPVFDNATCCAALGSKLKYTSIQSGHPELLISEDGFSSEEASRVIDRGGCHTVGIKTNEYCRYLTTYQCDDKKTGVSLICGTHSFLGGSIDIFRELFTNIDILKSHQKNKKRNGIDIEEVAVFSSEKNLDTQGKIKSVAIARILGGAIYVHDHLCMLKSVYNVKKLISIDSSNDQEHQTVSIDSVINDFARIKKYYVMAKALNAIN